MAQPSTRLRVRRLALLAAVVTAGTALLATLAAPHEIVQAQAAAEAPAPSVSAASQVAAGRYIVRIAGCNDCHTAGYAAKDGQIPEADWLTGDSVGWRGPWGTTYAANLRLYVQAFTPETWVRSLRARKDRLPPMPWWSLDAMSDQDLKAVFAYLQSLGPKGDQMPSRVPPGEEPKSPYVDMAPKLPGGAPMPMPKP